YPRTIAIQVRSLQANPGTEFFIRNNFTGDVIADIQKRLSITEVGSTDQLNMKTGILKISLVDKDPQRLASIVNTITETALQADSDNKISEANKTLDFLSKQIVAVKKSLDQAESALNQYRTQNNKLNLSVETELLLNNISDVEKQIFETDLKKNELLQYYTANHPFITQLNDRKQQLQQKLDLLEKQVKAIPEQNQVAISLVRDVKVKNQLYLLLFQKMQELQVVAAGTMSDIRILAKAQYPEKPQPQHLSIKLPGALFISLVFGILLGLIRTALYRKVQDPTWTEQNFNISNLAIIPYSKKQVTINQLIKKNINIGSRILAFNAPHDLSIEALRSLRTHLQFTIQMNQNHIISILGISPNIGKSFVSTNLAYLMAEAGKRTLLIDSDMRRGRINSYFELQKSPGLSEYLKGSAKDVIQKTGHPNLEIITSGQSTNDSSELLTRPQLGYLIQNLVHQYEFIIIDTPPILAVTDSLIVAKMANINILLLGSDTHHTDEIEYAFKRLSTNEIKLQGTVYNQTKPEKYSQKKYHYYYEYEKV
ncbi:MAG: polysaccharide biosynthesis tyrosine autokinase, partial [Proteobacteria bacterium]|nr:polysaccharide biosynthesis tyrosine autokinase [Pseudomonadota bacterium]